MASGEPTYILGKKMSLWCGIRKIRGITPPEGRHVSPRTRVGLWGSHHLPYITNRPEEVSAVNSGLHR